MLGAKVEVPVRPLTPFRGAGVGAPETGAIRCRHPARTASRHVGEKARYDLGWTKSMATSSTFPVADAALVGRGACGASKLR